VFTARYALSLYIRKNAFRLQRVNQDDESLGRFCHENNVKMERMVPENWF
jgi:hypothetical protein